METGVEEKMVFRPRTTENVSLDRPFLFPLFHPRKLDYPLTLSRESKGSEKENSPEQYFYYVFCITLFCREFIMLQPRNFLSNLR